jgi:hypothetical protein
MPMVDSSMPRMVFGSISKSLSILDIDSRTKRMIVEGHVKG